MLMLRSAVVCCWAVRGRGHRFSSDKSEAKAASAVPKDGTSCAEGSFIKVVQTFPVAELVMCRPKQLNAVGEGFFAELRDALQWLNGERQVRVAILRAEGKIFCSGLDLKEAQDIFSKSISVVEKAKMAGTVLGSKLVGTSAAPKPTEKGPPAMRNMELFRMMQRWHKSVSMIRTCRVPVIAAIHGKCIGAGTDLAAATDIRLCTADAEFSMRQTKMAIVPDLGTLQFVKHLMGSGVARELAFTGRDFKADEALQAGFVNKVFPTQEALYAGAAALAADIAANSPLAVQGAKHVLNYAEEHTIEDGLQQMAMWNAAFLKSEDLFTAVSSFMTKTKPKFSNAMEPPPQ